MPLVRCLALATLLAAFMAGCTSGKNDKNSVPPKEAPPALTEVGEVETTVIAKVVTVPGRNDRLVAGD